MIVYNQQTRTFPIEWKTKRFPVYRILDSEEWMENFFSTGELQLSSFSKFKGYKDEMQGDSDEGDYGVWFDDDKNNSHYLKYEAGLNAFILSTTQTLSDQVINDFKGKCAIKINHPTYFALEIAKKLPFVSSGLEGLCDYVDSRMQFLERQDYTDHLLLAIKDKNNPIAKEFLNHLTDGIEIFAKHNRYKHQQEYRFVWFSDNQVSSTIMVNCPEAVRYCERVILS
ncbi:MAG: hypothetical protein WEC59_11290 [Salibacteraceae bacterium]